MPSIRIVEYLDMRGRSPFSRWLDELDPLAASKVSVAVYRLGEGNFSNAKGVGRGIFERTIDFGPGYRIYFGKDGDTVVVLLGGSTKKRQQDAIDAAIQHWTDYRRRKLKG